MQLQRELELAVRAVKFAGERVLSSAKDISICERKGYADFATNIDYEVQTYLADQLRQICPQAGLLTEEAGESQRFDGQLKWILDPIDGTTNLLHLYPHFAISLALCLEETVQFGIVLNPLTNELFTAFRGRGSFLNNSPIRVSTSDRLEDCLISTGLPYDRSKAHEMFRSIERVFGRCQEIRRAGASSLDLAFLACGRSDGYFELDLKPWDFSAGALIVREAGGRVTNLLGKEVGVNPTSVVASNGQIHAELLEAMDMRAGKFG